ncbi:MAG TPA: hypothetical protein VLA77_01080 [Candidatus Saccharimonadales bacterium]|nr:hypothetical protein [Candidatus Saccharimonadales bacterium]
MDDIQPSQSQQMQGKKSSQKTLIGVLIGLLVVALLAIGWLVWQWTSLNQQITNLKNQNSELQARILDLQQKQVTATPSTPSDACDPTVTNDLQANIADAINSGNTAALEGYMADTVTVIIAASEGIGDRTPAQAVADLDYLNSATDPWEFEPDAATIAMWDAGFYTDYFDDNTYVGRSADGKVVVFDFDCGKISEIFMVANEDLLL